MSLYDVKLALQRNWYQPIQLLSTYGLAKENISYTPIAGKPYVQFTFAPNNPSPLGMGEQSVGVDNQTGLYYIEVYEVANEGDAQANNDFETIKARYYTGKNLTYNGQAVQIIACGREAGGIVDDSWYRFRINISWRAQTPR